MLDGGFLVLTSSLFIKAACAIANTSQRTHLEIRCR
jgi:hypothetical protein